MARHKSAPLFGYDLKESIIKTLTAEKKALTISELIDKIVDSQLNKERFEDEDEKKRLRQRVSDAIDGLKLMRRIHTRKHTTKVKKWHYITVCINKKHPNYGA